MKSEVQRRSEEFEEFLASVLGGRRVSGSGSSWSHDADVRTDRFLVEAKWTANKSASVKVSVWDKVDREALLAGLTPLLALRVHDRDLVVLSLDDFRALAGD